MGSGAVGICAAGGGAAAASVGGAVSAPESIVRGKRRTSQDPRPRGTAKRGKRACPAKKSAHCAPYGLIRPSHAYYHLKNTGRNSHRTTTLRRRALPRAGFARLVGFPLTAAPSFAQVVAMGRRPFKCYRYQKNKPYPKSRFNRGVPGAPPAAAGRELLPPSAAHLAASR